MVELKFTNALDNVLTLKSHEATSEGEIAITEYGGFTQSFTANLSTETHPFQQGKTTVGVSATQRTLSITINIFRTSNGKADDYTRNILNFTPAISATIIALAITVIAATPPPTNNVSNIATDATGTK